MRWCKKSWSRSCGASSSGCLFVLLLVLWQGRARRRCRRSSGGGEDNVVLGGFDDNEDDEEDEEEPRSSDNNGPPTILVASIFLPQDGDDKAGSLGTADGGTIEFETARMVGRMSRLVEVVFLSHAFFSLGCWAWRTREFLLRKMSEACTGDRFVIIGNEGGEGKGYAA
jgi:hypothetical protein